MTDIPDEAKPKESKKEQAKAEVNVADIK